MYDVWNMFVFLFFRAFFKIILRTLSDIVVDITAFQSILLTNRGFSKKRKNRCVVMQTIVLKRDRDSIFVHFSQRSA